MRTEGEVNVVMALENVDGTTWSLAVLRPSLSRILRDLIGSYMGCIVPLNFKEILQKA